MPKMQENAKELPLPYRLIPPCILSLLTVITYWPSLHYAFQFDDVANIQKHFYIRHHTLWSLWFSGSRWISYWLNAVHYNIGKFDPFSYRLGNLLIHTTNGVLLFFVILFALLHSKGKPFFKKHALALATVTSMLFLLHPVQTQTVSYVCQGQLEGLACMGILSMVLIFFHMCYTAPYGRKIALGALLFTVAVFTCFTKEIAVIAPILLLLVDWFFVAHGDRKSLQSRWMLHAALFALIVGIYMWYLKPAFFTNILGLKMEVKNNIGNVITQNRDDMIRPWPFFISQFKVILHYLGMFVWPFSISVEYDWVLARSFFAPDCIIPFFILVGLALGIFRMLYTHRTHVIAFGALWFFICIAPRSSIIPSPELLVDYKTYTASIGWLFILACGIIKGLEYTISLLRDHQRNLMYAPQARVMLSASLILPLCFMTRQRNLVWSSGSEFWMNVIQNAPNKARAYNNYAVELSQTHKRYEEAIPYFNKAAQMDRSYSDPLNNLAVCYSSLNQIDKAIDALHRGLKINPYYPEGYNNLASFYLQKKDYANTEIYLKAALQIRPHYGKAYFNMGRMYTENNEPEKGLEYFKKACTIADLDNEFGFKIYAQAALNLKEYDEAAWGFKKALECNPHDTDIMFGLANSYYLAKKAPEAKQLYATLLAQNSNDLRVWFNLGETYLLEENYAEAFKCFKHIEPQCNKLPQTRIRLANCYEKMGNLDAARNELQILAKSNLGSPQLRENAAQLLTKMNEYYGGPTAIQPIVVA